MIITVIMIVIEMMCRRILVLILRPNTRGFHKTLFCRLAFMWSFRASRNGRILPACFDYRAAGAMASLAVLSEDSKIWTPNRMYVVYPYYGSCQNRDIYI